MSNGGPQHFPADLRVLARPKRRVFPGRSEQVTHARHFVAQALDGSPSADEAVLCVSELATNALLHSASGNGGEFEVIVCRGQTSALIAVYDDGSDAPPTARELDATSEDGRGLGVVALTASRWGHFGGKSGRVVWFELSWNPPLADATRSLDPIPPALAAHRSPASAAVTVTPRLVLVTAIGDPGCQRHPRTLDLRDFGER